MNIEMKSYPMIVDQFLKMLRSPKLTNEEIGETIATFLYDETIENQVEILNYALLIALKNYKNKKAWDEREGKKFREDLLVAKRKMAEIEGTHRRGLKLDGNEVTGFVPDDIEF